MAWRPEPELVARFAAMDLRVPLGTPQTVPAYDPARPWTHQEIRAHRTLLCSARRSGCARDS